MCPFKENLFTGYKMLPKFAIPVTYRPRAGQP
jgi:hypothetical protein